MISPIGSPENLVMIDRVICFHTSKSMNPKHCYRSLFILFVNLIYLENYSGKILWMGGKIFLDVVT
jgi:hypothetical protein